MGLKAAGDYGAKKVFIEKFGDSIANFESLYATREAIGADRTHTVVVQDGNVLLMQTPTNIDTFMAYKEYMINQIQIGINAGEHVVVCFDEPENITEAKKAEQNARDARRTVKTPICSVDLVACPVDDHYDRAALEDPGLNVRLLMDHRQARSRFFDAVCCDVLAYFRTEMPSMIGWSLTFDGIDARGVDRPRGEKRVPGVVTSHPVWEQILVREHPVGEGDLKLPAVCHAVTSWRRRNAATKDVAVTNIRLFLLQTIDTDSLVIELIQQSRREAEAYVANDESKMETVLLCLREPARKRKPEDGGGFSNAYFRCIDVESMHTELMSYLFLNPDKTSFVDRRAAVVLFAACIALCGSDFVEIPGLRSDLMMSAVRESVRHTPDVLRFAYMAYTGVASSTAEVVKALSFVIDAYVSDLTNETNVHMRKKREQASNIHDLQLLRGAWLAAYWTGNEFKETHDWGFNATSKA